MDWNKLAQQTVVKPGSKVTLPDDFDPSRKPADMTREEGLAHLEEGKLKLFELQDRFYAQADRSLLIVLQAMDAAGKDSTIKHVMSGVNPEGVDVHSFKGPSSLERSHDFLWRHNLALPEFGRIGIFNRSHYENVLVTRVHPEMLWPAAPTMKGKLSDIWKRRYDAINEWERHLTDNGTTVVKFFLNVSKDEQARRFLARIEDPAKNWKFSAADVTERGFWDEYQGAFSAMLSHTSTDYAPWHVIPADHKWFSRLSTFAVLLETMRSLDPRYPTVPDDELAKMRAEGTKLAEELS